MSIKAYVGRMGSGKSYEVVSHVILSALRSGRRVLSNIAGLNYQAMVDYLVSEGVDKSEIGELVIVDHAQVMQANFWRTDKDAQQGIDATIQPGDLVALDEVWRFWSGFGTKGDDGQKRPDRVMNFFRMHRHFPHPKTGVTCDVALITQDIMDLSRQIRAVVEETFRMEKLTALGSTKRYRVDIFQGGKVTRSPMRQLQRSYDPRFFPMYSSHSQAGEGDAKAREENIDKRGNILQGALFKFVIPAMVLVMALSVWFVWGFFHPSQKPKEQAQAKEAQAPKDQKTPPAPAPDKAKPESVTDDSWRIVGVIRSASGMLVHLSNGKASRYVLNPPVFKVSPLTYELQMPNGEFVTSWATVGAHDEGLIK